MTKKIKTISYASTAVIIGLVLMAPQVFASHAWGKYHWARQTASFTLPVLDSMSSQWKSSLSGAVADWSTSAVLDLATSTASSKGCRGQDGKVQVCNGAYGDTGWLGIASVWAYSDGHIAKATAKMNDTYFDTDYYNTAAWRNLVVCQEIGHTFGLGHQDEDHNNPNLGTCMDYTSSPESNQNPNDHDYEELAVIYAHTDSFDSYAKISTVGGGGGTGKGKPQDVGQDIDHNNPSSWGEIVKRDGQGNPSVYSRNLGNGQSVITHVTWIEGYESADHD